MKHHDRKDFEHLCHAVLEGTVTESELGQFQEHLRHSSEARKAYAEQMQIHAFLTWQQGRAAVPAPVVLPSIDFQSSPKIISFPFGKAALAAAAVLIATFAFWLVSDRNQSGAAVAINQDAPVAAPKGVMVDILASSGAPYQVGQRVALDRLEMSTG